MLALSPPGMLPGSRLLSLAQLVSMPEHAVVLRRSHARAHLRAAWTLLIGPPGTRAWTSAGWRWEPTDEELFDAAKEFMVVLYRPHERFGIGLLNTAGQVASQANVVVYPGLQDVKGDIGRRAAKDPMAAILHRIDPGPWIVHEGN